MSNLRMLSNLMEDHRLRLQTEAELKREISEDELMEEVQEMYEDCKGLMRDLSCSLTEAYKQIMQ